MVRRCGTRAKPNSCRKRVSFSSSRAQLQALEGAERDGDGGSGQERQPGVSARATGLAHRGRLSVMCPYLLHQEQQVVGGMGTMLAHTPMIAGIA